MTIYKPVRGYEDNYLVGAQGAIYSKLRKRFLSQVKNAGGYKKVCLSKNGEIKTKLVHRLVAEAFIGEAAGLEVNHKNGIRDDNRADNLELVTKAENERHAWRVLGKKPTKYWDGRKGFDHACSVPVIAKNKRGDGFWFPGISEAAREIGASAGHICSCCKGNRKTHKGFSWSYVPFPTREE